MNQKDCIEILKSDLPIISRCIKSGVEEVAIFCLNQKLEKATIARIIQNKVTELIKEEYGNCYRIKNGLRLLVLENVFLRFNKLDKNTIKPRFNETSQTDRFYNQSVFFDDLELYNPIEEEKEAHLIAGWILDKAMKEVEAIYLVCLNENREHVWHYKIEEQLSVVMPKPEIIEDDEEEFEPMRIIAIVEDDEKEA